MTDLRDDFSRICNALGKISLLAQLRDKVRYALEAHNKRCGQCDHWMKSRECPREHNVKGFSRGPSSGDPICGKFSITKSALDIQKSRALEAIEFAKEHDLPIPDHLLERCAAADSSGALNGSAVLEFPKGA